MEIFIDCMSFFLTAKLAHSHCSVKLLKLFQTSDNSWSISPSVRMKRGLQDNEPEDGGGPSGECERTLKRLCDPMSQGDLEGISWENLPQEILLHIFQYLPLLDRAFASQVPMCFYVFMVKLQSEACVYVWFLLNALLFSKKGLMTAATHFF